VVTDGVVVETHAGNPLDFVSDYQKRFKVCLARRFATVLWWLGRLFWLRHRASHRKEN